MIAISNSAHWVIVRDIPAVRCDYRNMRDHILGCVAVTGTREAMLRKRATIVAFAAEHDIAIAFDFRNFIWAR
jgi:hypothetical protein